LKLFMLLVVGYEDGDNIEIVHAVGGGL
jgi:hypothetical protein